MHTSWINVIMWLLVRPELVTSIHPIVANKFGTPAFRKVHRWITCSIYISIGIFTNLAIIASAIIRKIFRLQPTTLILIRDKVEFEMMVQLAACHQGPFKHLIWLLCAQTYRRERDLFFRIHKCCGNYACNA